MESNKSTLYYKKWLYELTDMHFEIIKFISIYPCVLSNLFIILTSMLTGLDLFRKKFEFWIIIISSLILDSTTITNQCARSLKVYYLLALFEFYSMVNIILYHMGYGDERIFINTASFITYSQNSFKFLNLDKAP
jgi:hypothetical protein